MKSCKVLSYGQCHEHPEMGQIGLMDQFSVTHSCFWPAVSLQHVLACDSNVKLGDH